MRKAASAAGLALAAVLAGTFLTTGIDAEAASAQTQQEINANNQAIVNSSADSILFDIGDYLTNYNFAMGYRPSRVGNFPYAYGDDYVVTLVGSGEVNYYTYTSGYLTSQLGSDGAVKLQYNYTVDQGNITAAAILKEWDGQLEPYMTVAYTYDQYGRISDSTYYNPDNKETGHTHFSYSRNHLTKASSTETDYGTNDTNTTVNKAGQIVGAKATYAYTLNLGNPPYVPYTVSYNADRSIAEIVEDQSYGSGPANILHTEFQY